MRSSELTARNRNRDFGAGGKNASIKADNRNSNFVCTGLQPFGTKLIEQPVYYACFMRTAERRPCRELRPHDLHLVELSPVARPCNTACNLHHSSYCFKGVR